jgi:hypothetical protein
MLKLMMGKTHSSVCFQSAQVDELRRVSVAEATRDIVPILASVMTVVIKDKENKTLSSTRSLKSIDILIKSGIGRMKTATSSSAFIDQ